MSAFDFEAPNWVNTGVPKNPEEALRRAKDLASSFYPLGVQTGVHAMIEWCGVMGEHAKMLEYAWKELGVEPEQVDQHSGTRVEVPPYMVEYFCEKLGCQLKPFIRGNKDLWKKEINKWFK